MKKVVAGGIFATLLAASTAFAFELPASQPTKHEPEGPDTRYGAVQSILGIEGPDGR